MVEHHQRDPNPKYNSGQTEGGSGMGIRCEDQTQGSVHHMTSYRTCNIEGSVTTDAGGDTGDQAGHWWTILHIHMQGQREVNQPSMSLW